MSERVAFGQLVESKAMAKSKSSKATSNLDVVNVDLRATFEGVVNLEAELIAYEKALLMLNSKQISVRGLKATIEASQEKGDLPTIKPSTAQYFLDSEKVRALSGGKDKPLKAVLNATIQAKRMFGKEFASAVESAGTFAELVRITPKQGEKAKAKRKSAPVADSVDAYVALFMGAKGLTDLKVGNKKEWDSFINLVKRISDYNKATHPAIRSKVSA